MRFGLVPVGDREDIVHALEQPEPGHPDLLDRDPQIRVEPDWIGDVPPVHRVHGGDRLLEVAHPGRVPREEQRVAAVGRGERERARFGIGAQVILERPRAPGVVLQAGGGQRRQILVAVEVELHLSLSPPEPRQRRHPDVRPQVAPASPHAVQDDVVLPRAGRGVGPSPLGVEGGGPLRDVVAEGVVDLEEHGADLHRVLAGHRDAGVRPEGHRQIAVHPGRGSHDDRLRRDESPLPESVEEEVPQGDLHRGAVLAVPVHAQHEVAQDERTALGPVRHGHPQVADDAGTVDVRQREGLTGPDRYRGPALPPRPQRRGRRGRSSLPAGRVLRVDRPGDHARDRSQFVELHVMSSLCRRRRPPSSWSTSTRAAPLAAGQVPRGASPSSMNRDADQYSRDSGAGTSPTTMSFTSMPPPTTSIPTDVPHGS